MISIGEITRLYKNAGAPMADLFDCTSAQVFLGCPVLMLGAADENTSLFVPSRTTKGHSNRVVYCTLSGPAAQAIVLGGIAPASIGSILKKEGQEGNEAEHYDVRHLTTKDAFLRHCGAAVVITIDGVIVLDTTESGRDVNIQLSQDSALRIIRDSAAPTERVMMGGPTREYLDNLMNKVMDLASATAALGNLVHIALATIPPNPALTAATAAVGTLVEELNKLYNDEYPMTDERMLSGDFLISDKSVPQNLY